MIWTFSDGTTVRLGGDVQGSTLFAERLRDMLEREPRVGIWPEPGGSVNLDLNDPALLDAWLRSELGLWITFYGSRFTLARPSGIPELPPVPGDDEEADEDVVY